MTSRAVSDDFIAAFESCAIDPVDFRHTDHIYLAWLYLRRYPVEDVVGRISRAIRQFAVHSGQDGLYHETITFAYVFLINERMAKNAALDWQQFFEANPDLFESGLAALRKYYCEETLSSDRARRVFVLPDKNI